MVMNSGFSHWKWWFSIVMLVYQRVLYYQSLQWNFFGNSFGIVFFHYPQQPMIRIRAHYRYNPVVFSWFSWSFLDHITFWNSKNHQKSSTRFIGCLLFRATKWSHPSTDHKSESDHVQGCESLTAKGWRIPAWCLWCSSTAGGLSFKTTG